MEQRSSRHDVRQDDPNNKKADPTPPSAEAASSAPPPRPLEPWGNDFAAAFGSLRSSIDDSASQQPQEQPQKNNVSQLVEEKLVRPFLYRQWNKNDSSSKTTAAAVKELLKHQSILQPIASLVLLKSQQPSSTNNSTDKDSSSSLPLLHSVQLQVCLRLALWRWAGDLFVKQYNKQNWGRKKKKKKAHAHRNRKELQNRPEALLLNDILGLLQLALVRIGTEVEVMQFLQQCLRQEDCEAMPTITQQIWEFFEKPNPYKQQQQDQQQLQPDGDAVDRLLSLGLSPPAKKKKRVAPPPPPPTNKENQQPPAAAPDPKQPKSEDSLLPTTNVSLTAAHPRRRPNRLLGGGSDARRSFVGSHFNSSLSNAASLFRQVPAVVRGSSSSRKAAANSSQTNGPQPKIKKRSNPLQEETGRMAPPRKRGPTTSTSKTTTPNKEFVVPATPLAGHKKQRSSSTPKAQQQHRSRVPETPCAVPETPQQPAPQPPGLALVARRPAAPNMRLPPPASLVVAEAWSSLAVQKARREERRHKSPCCWDDRYWYRNGWVELILLSLWVNNKTDSYLYLMIIVVRRVDLEIRDSPQISCMSIRSYLRVVWCFFYFHVV